MFNPITTSFHIHQPIILEKISTNFNAGLEQVKDLCCSHYAKSISPLLKAAQKIQYLAELFFSTYLPHKELCGLAKIVKESTCLALSALSDTTAKIKYILNFLKIANLPKEAQKNFKERHRAKKSRNRDKIASTNFKALQIISEFFEIPDTFSKFVRLFSTAIPKQFEQFTVLCNLVHLILSPSRLVARAYGYKTTAELINILQTARYQAFIKAQNEIFKTPSEPSTKPLQISAFKHQVKAMKKKLKAINMHQQLESIRKTANSAFVDQLAKEIELQPNIIKKQFKIKNIEKDSYLLGSSNLKNTTPENLAAIVKTLKVRLQDKIYLDKCSIVHKSIALLPSALNLSVALAAIFTPQILLAPIFTPVAASFTALLAIASVFNIYYKQHCQKKFSTQMKKLCQR